ncbi:transglutaminase family protein [Lichenihabitans sp. Uapishka_5]|uniref:transglutaminase family protein n=1 Tax=Lichenihabitans sp. Uapishka_5 TaxID=3037302 RepID=UPI0029E80F9D|nr:transglutaminase family protein [Lichenihabitans sp. Uapishka_5]MDX7950613.1 transglutaminase family protein [Lichenihabitans sp. Uapishka_5]
MRLRLRHQLRLRFPEPVRNLIAVLRMAPRSHEGQRVTNWRIDVDPDCLLKAGEDHFGNLVHTLTLPGTVSELSIIAQGELTAFDAAGIVRGSAERLPVDLYRRDTTLTAPDETVRRFASEAVQGADSPIGRLHHLMGAIHERIEATSETGAILPAARSLEAGRGTAREHAQLFATCARSLGFPARCSAGYYLDDGTASRRHSWAEAYVEGLGWVGFDTVHDICPQDHHVRVAVGLDAVEAGTLRSAYGVVPEESVEVRWLLGRDPGPLAATPS